ncbi:hypothetical protein G5S34_04620 [Herbaspirillum frisingense]|uniref:hypothetical protein n=1 Tax=Herbaspirillum frisingense TaxID=92645 RepID=UPI001602401C|nr:hypothetical protein [Herbaspirillum frisingense]QNB06124.1 hypothetical protein G5S34_04620 [Herbaspirillum frisingense]
MYDQTELIHADDTRWRSRSARSERSDAESTLVIPAEDWHIWVNVNSHGYYILPVLLLPAWISVRIALRPLSNVLQEVASRGPQELAPLQSTPKHQELRSVVDCINDLLTRVDESAERERALIADAAHELRAPLAAMHVNVEALLAHAPARHNGNCSTASSAAATAPPGWCASCSCSCAARLAHPRRCVCSA